MHPDDRPSPSDVSHTPALRRVAVIGVTGSGKSTLARDLAVAVGAPVMELDAVYHQQNWQPIAEAEMRRRVAAVSGMERWVIDGGYSVVRDLVWAKATAIVWVDLARSTVMRRIIGRTLRRVLSRTHLWNGNRERVRNLVSTDPEVNIILWAWTTHPKRRRTYAAAMSDPAWSQAHWIRLRTPTEVAAFMAGITPVTGGGG